MNRFGLALVIATTLFPAFQLLSLSNITDQAALFSQYLGLASLILMSWGQIWATRIAGIEGLFGGLDRVYVLHKWAGIVAITAILLHDTIDADMQNVGEETILSDLAETLGEISLYGLLILVVISVATFVPYHFWKWTHKAMGAFFALGAFHFFFILKPFNMTDSLGLYTGGFCVAGLLAYFWTLLPGHMRPFHDYKISDLEETGGALAITLTPEKSGMKPRPGQFGIFQFLDGANNEPHPFSFSKLNSDGSVRVTIKVLGDFTSDLRQRLEVGHKVRIQGPYGRFQPAEQNRQVWVAGGIGITPFLTWAEALKQNDPATDFFLCVRSRAEAPHLSDIEHLAASKSNLTLHLFVSNEGKRLTVEGIFERVGKSLGTSRVSFCGPVALRKSLQTGLQKYRVGPKDFHYEEFEFRTGIGLKSVAEWILKRSS